GSGVGRRACLFTGADNKVMPCIGRGAGRDHNRNSAEKDYANEDVDLAIVDLHRLKRKNSSAVWVVISATSSSKMPRAVAIDSATSRVCAGSQRFPRNGTGARYGQSVSTMNLSSGIRGATARTVGPFLP